MSAEDRTDIEQIRRSYRFMFATAVTLAVIGAPVFMQGAVALATTLVSASSAPSRSPVQALILFSLSSLPMLLAGFAWRRTQDFQRFLDQEP